MSGCNQNYREIRKLVYVSIVDWAFISHRLTLADEAIKRGFSVYLVTKDTGKFDFLRSRGINCININFTRSGINIFYELFISIKLFLIYKQIKPNFLHHIGLKSSIYGSLVTIFFNRKIKIINAITGLGYLFTNNRKSLFKIIAPYFLICIFKRSNIFFIFQNSDDLYFCKKNKIVKNNYKIIKGSSVDPLSYIQKDYTNKNNKINIVLVARMLKDKGIIEFLKAAELLRLKYHNLIQFQLIGGLDFDNPTAIQESDLSLWCDNSYIKWLGHRNDIKTLYSNADIVCLPSYREGLPKALVEAMAIGCPIITTDAIGCKDCVDDGINGFLVPIFDHVKLSDCIEKLVLDENLRIKMGKKSREKMEKEMTISHLINDTFELYS